MPVLPDKTWDLVIIGSGISGLAAARLARERGLDFCVVADGFGATLHWSGACDLMDPRWRDPGPRPAGFTGWETELAVFAKAHPGHPYADLLRDVPDFPARIISDMRGFLEFYGVPFTGDGKNPVIVLGSSGRPKWCPFAMRTQGMSAGDMGGRRGAVCVDFPDLTDFPANLIGDGLAPLFGSVRVAAIGSLTVNNLSPLASLIALFDRDDRALDMVIRCVRNLNDPPGVVVIPPVLGVTRWRQNFDKLQSETGARVVELLSGLPAVAGLRLRALLDLALERHGIPRFAGHVTGFKTDGARVTALTIQLLSSDETSSEAQSAKREANDDYSLHAHQFVFAGGKYLGGGIKHGGSFSEPLFGLPLYADGRRLGRESHVTHHISSASIRSQGFMRVGTVVDKHGRPTNDGHPVFENLRACGHILGGFDFTRERCGFGLSVASARRVMG